MERYLGEYGSNYSSRMYRLLLVGYGAFFLAILSLLAQAYEEISAGRNLSGEYAPLALQDYLGLLFIFACIAGLLYLLYRVRSEKDCGDLAPHLAEFLAMSTREVVPVGTVAEVLRVKPEKTAPLLRTMMKRKYIRNLEISDDKKEVRILQFHRIYVFTVYCKNCGAEYTQTSEDDYICQYCGHPVRKS